MLRPAVIIFLDVPMVRNSGRDSDSGSFANRRSRFAFRDHLQLRPRLVRLPNRFVKVLPSDGTSQSRVLDAQLISKKIFSLHIIIFSPFSFPSQGFQGGRICHLHIDRIIFETLTPRLAPLHPPCRSYYDCDLNKLIFD
jgi:hypothetical protein